MRTLNSYLVHHTPPEASQSPNISSGTLDALENAEKLVQEARQTIIEASYSVPTLHFIAERQPPDVDENELYIRDVVTAKFQKANKQISSNTFFSTDTKRNVEINSPSRAQSKISKETIEWGRVRSRGMKKKMGTCKECLMSKDDDKLRGQMSLGTTHSGKGTRVVIKPQLSLRNVERLDLFPTDTNSKTSLENVKTYQFKHDSSHSATINESLIDAAVQTSLCELTLKERSTSTDKLTGLPVNSVQTSSTNQVNHQSTIENSPMHLAASGQANGGKQRSKETNIKESRGSFLDFLRHMAEMEKNKCGNIEKNEVKNDNLEQETVLSDDDEIFYHDFDPKGMVLDPPNVEKFDEIIRELDKKMEEISEGIDELNTKFSPITALCKMDDLISVKHVGVNTSPIIVSRNEESPTKKTNLKIRNGEEKCSDVRASVKFLLRPRSRISSTDSGESSETMLPPARFSTPLNNYRQDIPTANIDVKNSRDSVEEFFIPIIEPDMKNDTSKVIMTRNKLSSITSMNGNSSEIGRRNDTANIDINSHTFVKNDEKTVVAQNIQANTTITLYSDNEDSKSLTVDTKEEECNEVVDNNELAREIKIVNQSSSIAVSNDKKTATINSQETFDYKYPGNNIESSHDSCQTMKSECTNLNMDEQNNKVENGKQSIVILDKTNPTPLELSTRDRTSLDVSAIYSESFEVSSVAELKSTSVDIINRDRSETLIEETRVEIHSVNGAIDDTENIKKPIGTSSFQQRENKTDTSLSQLSESPNSDHIKSNEKIESDRNTISIFSSSSSSLRKVSSINSVSSSQKSNEFKKKFSADDCYSEGELYLPSSCSYSLGEIRIAERDQQNNTDKINIFNDPVSFVSPISNSPTQSPGEILETDIESNSSIEKEH